MYFKTYKITFWFESITLFFTCTISFPNPATRARLNVTMRILNPEFSLGICNYSDSFHSTYAILFFSVRPSLVVNHNLLCSLCALFLAFGANWLHDDSSWYVFPGFSTHFPRSACSFQHFARFAYAMPFYIFFSFPLILFYIVSRLKRILWKICFLSIRQFNFAVIPTWPMGMWIIEEHID